MGLGDRVHDRELLDRLEAVEGTPISSKFYRVSRSGRDPSRGYSANGRWSKAGELEVLYTAETQDGALAEIGYRLALEPIWPSRLSHEIAELKINLDNVCNLTDFTFLRELGVDLERYKTHQYETTQAISSAARFLEFDAILVPNARYSCSNLVVYTEVVDASCIETVNSSGVEWSDWRSKNRGLPTRNW